MTCHHRYERVQLFNIDDDPGELHDLGAAPEARARRDSLLAELRSGWGPDRIGALERTRRRDHEILRAACGSRVQAAAVAAGDVWEGPVENVFPEA